MPKTKGAKEALKNFQDQYGEEEGKRVYYATAKKQGRDPDTFQKESLKLVDDVIIEQDCKMVVLPKGLLVSEAVPGDRYDHIDYNSWPHGIDDSSDDNSDVPWWFDDYQLSPEERDLIKAYYKYNKLVDMNPIRKFKSKVQSMVNSGKISKEDAKEYYLANKPDDSEWKIKSDKIQNQLGLSDKDLKTASDLFDKIEDSVSSGLNETVGSGAIALIPNALDYEEEEEEVEEASNSQISTLNLDY